MRERERGNRFERGGVLRGELEEELDGVDALPRADVGGGGVEWR